MSIQSTVDYPVSGSSYFRQRIPIEGWVYGDYRHERLKRISAHAPGGEIGATNHFFVRRDVTESLRLGAEVRTGFRFVGTFADAYMPRELVGIEVRAEFADGSIVPLAGIHVKITPNDFTGAPYGDFCNPHRTMLAAPHDVLFERKPTELPHPDCVALLEKYLPRGGTVLDVNCGHGAYYDAVRRGEHTWIGCESSIEALHGLALRSRPHRAVVKPWWPWATTRLPAADQEFDASIGIDILDYAANPSAMLREMKRVTKTRAIFSVYNFEKLPYLTDRSVVPWALLERNRRHLFTRYSLRPLLASVFRHVEILDYGLQPLSSPDGLPLHSHLFAVCDV